MASGVPHVALFVETSRGYGRSLLRGIMQYLGEHGPWALYLQPRGLEARLPGWLNAWQGDGILVRVENRAMARAVCETRLLAVNLLQISFPDLPLPVIAQNNSFVGELAYRHLRDRGFQHFAFYGFAQTRHLWLEKRRQSFEKLVRESGHECHRFVGASSGQRAPSWEEGQDRLGDWLKALPKPVGLMAANDDHGLEVLEACRRVGVPVPDEVAVIGVDNDEFLCNLSDPPMSSISPNAERIGYEAAALLDRLMAGARPPRKPILFPPGGIVARRSTDVVATDDRDLATVIRYIREHACEGLRLKDFLKTSRLSPRELQRRVQRFLGHTLKDEITRVQLDRAKQLLTETELSAVAIAEKCGFAHAQYFSKVFHARVGLPPGAYRRKLKQ